jgi:hypothetical protein
MIEDQPKTGIARGIERTALDVQEDFDAWVKAIEPKAYLDLLRNGKTDWLDRLVIRFAGIPTEVIIRTIFATANAGKNRSNK